MLWNIIVKVILIGLFFVGVYNSYKETLLRY